MATDTGRSPAEAGSGHSAEPEPISVVSAAVAASVPNAAQIDELLHPLRGIERGLLPIDPAGKLIRIKIGEVRKIAACLRAAKKERVELCEFLATIRYCAATAERDATGSFKADFANIRIVAEEALAKALPA